MVDPCLIHVGRVPADSPATHVLIIGVGHYDHLPGGGGKCQRRVHRRFFRIYRLRKQVVEPVFGQIKQARGFRQFLMRGLD